MKIFLSVGEPSGDVHGGNLIDELRGMDPSLHVTGFGGRRMIAAGAELIHPLAEQPIFGILPALKAVPFLLGMLRRADDRFRRERPDAVVLIDNPGFNWHVARAAKQRGIPVIYYVPPQIWAWGTWRVRKMRRCVDHVLCSLPFEEPWYHARGIPGARYVGHPFFDEVIKRPLDDAFLAEQRAGDPRRIVALLPGSRTHEVHGNFGMMVAAAERIVRARDDVRFLVAGFKESQRPILEKTLAGSRLPAEVHVGRTHEIMRLATSAIAVSGSVSMELLHHRVPTTIVYRVGAWIKALAPLFMRARFITLVNLIAERELYPERFTTTDQSAALAGDTLRWLNDEPARLGLVAELDVLAGRVAAPGATARAARRILEVAGESGSRSRRPSDDAGSSAPRQAA